MGVIDEGKGAASDGFSAMDRRVGAWCPVSRAAATPSSRQGHRTDGVVRAERLDCLVGNHPFFACCRFLFTVRLSIEYCLLCTNLVYLWKVPQKKLAVHQNRRCPERKCAGLAKPNRQSDASVCVAAIRSILSTRGFL